jgi:hypothetical protein
LSRSMPPTLAASASTVTMQAMLAILPIEAV